MLATLKIDQGSIDSIKNTPILVENLRQVQGNILLTENFSLVNGKIEKGQIKLMNFQ
jgi:hypothetical protein